MTTTLAAAGRAGSRPGAHLTIGGLLAGDARRDEQHGDLHGQATVRRRWVLLTPRCSNRLDADVRITATAQGGGKVWLGATTPSDAKAVLGDSALEASGRSCPVACSLSGPPGGATPAIGQADLAQGTGSTSMTVDQTLHPTRSSSRREQGKVATVSIAVQRKAWSAQSLHRDPPSAWRWRPRASLLWRSATSRHGNVIAGLIDPCVAGTRRRHHEGHASLGRRRGCLDARWLRYRLPRGGRARAGREHPRRPSPVNSLVRSPGGVLENAAWPGEHCRGRGRHRHRAAAPLRDCLDLAGGLCHPVPAQWQHRCAGADRTSPVLAIRPVTPHPRAILATPADRTKSCTWRCSRPTRSPPLSPENTVTMLPGATSPAVGDPPGATLVARRRHQPALTPRQRSRGMPRHPTSPTRRPATSSTPATLMRPPLRQAQGACRLWARAPWPAWVRRTPGGAGVAAHDPSGRWQRPGPGTDQSGRHDHRWGQHPGTQGPGRSPEGRRSRDRTQGDHGQRHRVGFHSSSRPPGTGRSSSSASSSSSRGSHSDCGV